MKRKLTYIGVAIALLVALGVGAFLYLPLRGPQVEQQTTDDGITEWTAPPITDGKYAKQIVQQEVAFREETGVQLKQINFLQANDKMFLQYQAKHPDYEDNAMMTLVFTYNEQKDAYLLTEVIFLSYAKYRELTQ